MKFRDMKLLLVEWLDACSDSAGWNSMERLSNEIDALHCRSVGWLVRETKKEILLVPHIAGERNQGIRPSGAGDITIPKKTITKITVIRKSPKERKKRG